MMTTMGMKKMPVILVVCVLLFSSLDVLEAEHSFGPAECCFKYRTARLPTVKVVTFERTNIHCASYAVVFTMKNGAKICADPTEEWVQKLVTHLESTAPFEGSV